MLTILIDHNMEGQAVQLWDTILNTGLIELAPIEFVMFADVKLPENSNDREVWRFVQKSEMLLLTDNRSDNETTSLERTIRNENTATSLPVITVGRLSRLKERRYREQCAERLLEIVSTLENYLGTGRIFIP